MRCSPVDAQKYLDKYLNTKDPIDMKLVERSHWIARLTRLLSKPTPSLQKRKVICMYSCRGSGKTALLKYVAGKQLREWTAAGRILVRDCREAEKKEKPNWVEQLLVKRDPASALCHLVCAHVKEVTGQTIEPKNDPARAYDLWIRATKNRFDLDDAQSKRLRPIIMLDTCETLALESFPELRRKVKASRYYTALEAFCLEVPAPEAIVVFGCNASISTDPLTLIVANVIPLSGLLPLSVKGYEEAAAQSWDSTADDEVLIPLHELAGGIPRLLRSAHERYDVSLAHGAWDAVSTGMEEWREQCQSMYPHDSDCPRMYSMLLASATKFVVSGTQEVILPPREELRGPPPAKMSYKEATEASLCGRVQTSGSQLADDSSMTIVVPPILAGDETDFGMRKLPITPSQLHPLLESPRLKLRTSPDVRGRLFEKPFLYSLYARYLLVLWKNQRSSSASGWVPLEEFLAGAVSDAGRENLKGIEVCLKRGVKESPRRGDDKHAKPDTVTWTGGANRSAHHDAYLWCRTSGQPSGEFPHGMALQLSHGKEKEAREIYRQTFVSPDLRRPLALPLLVVCNDRAARDEAERRIKNNAIKGLSKEQRRALQSRVVFVDASAMSSTAWLKLVRQRRNRGAGRTSLINDPISRHATRGPGSR
jgi:hypothetical protein